MWLVAGIVIGGLILGGSYTLLSHWIHNNELKQARQGFDLLKDSVMNTCTFGTDRTEYEKYVFPSLVNNISVQNRTDGSLGKGYSLCIDIKDEGLRCEELDVEPNKCKISLVMDTLTFDNKGSLLSVIRKALKSSEVKSVEFLIMKRGEDNICVYWQQKYEDADTGIEPPYVAEGEECEDACDCGLKLLCDETSHCCPKKQYFDPAMGACRPYSGDSICQTYVGENCEDEPDCGCANMCCMNCLGAEESGCCPDGTVICQNTCVSNINLPEGSICQCDNQCQSGLACSLSHCCPDGTEWDGTECSANQCEPPDVNIRWVGTDTDSYTVGRPGSQLDSIVFHYTAGYSAESAHSYMMGKTSSAHYILDRDCKILQEVNEEDTAHHAGDFDFNKRSVGIEISNLGMLCGDAGYPPPAGSSCASSGGDDWEVYNDEQMQCLIELTYGIVMRNNIQVDRQHFRAHSEIQSGKSDPGPLFDWDKLIDGVNELKDCENEPAQSSPFAYLIEYADQFAQASCPYALNHVAFHTPSNCQAGGLTCATFVQSVVVPKTSVGSIPGNGCSICSNAISAGKATAVGGSSEAVPGDIISMDYAGGCPGHTALVAGKGNGVNAQGNCLYGSCYKGFQSSADGQLFIIHSIGESEGGEPGVVYQPFSNLGSVYSNIQICRLKEQYAQG